jgi:serine/threonine protein kinase
MVDDYGCAKLTDLGLTHFSGLLSVAFSQSLNDTARWSAPEMLDGNEVKPTTASDVYSLGMTILEVCDYCSPCVRPLTTLQDAEW